MYAKQISWQTEVHSTHAKETYMYHIHALFWVEVEGFLNVS